MNSTELKQLLLLANRFKDGDLSIGGTSDEQLSDDARRHISSLTLAELTGAELLEDRVTEALNASLNNRLASELSNLTVAQLKRILLDAKAQSWTESYRDGLSSEAIAAVVKVMSDEELSRVSSALFNPLSGSEITIGAAGHFGSRIQPNSPGDDEDEILFSIFEGLSYGCGDVILGLNPASDDVDTIVRLEELLCSVVTRLELPTRFCVLSDIVKQTAARKHTRVDVGFQSLAGTSAAMAGMVGLDVDGLVEMAGGFDGLYFETGQGSEVTNGAAEGADMVTLESRTYGLARAIARLSADRLNRNERWQQPWMIVNDVAGFIGPEVFTTADQLVRACLEDLVMAKVHGLTMGLDVCSTFHMGIEPATLRSITESIVRSAAPAYLMAVPGNADPMLGYMTTSFREHPRLRRLAGRQITSIMQRRLNAMGLTAAMTDAAAGAPEKGDPVAYLYAAYKKAGGDRRSLDALCEAGRAKVAELQTRGFDLGLERDAASDSGEAAASQNRSERRMQAIYEHARRSLMARVDQGVMSEVSPGYLAVRSAAKSREDYLSHPASGERIRDEDVKLIAALYPTRRPRVQILISDGLNANAVNENVKETLASLKRELVQAGCHVVETDIVLENGRVRAGYHVGALLGADVIIHFIGERPGTGLNLLSAYVTYGRDHAGALRWDPLLDHSCTTAICGISRAGKHPVKAAAEVARVVRRMLTEQRSGVDLV